MVITIIIAIVHQHATKDSQELLIFRLSILGEGFNVFSYYLSPSCQVNCIPALICKTKRPGHKSTTKQRTRNNEKKNNHNLENTNESMLIQYKEYKSMQTNTKQSFPRGSQPNWKKGVLLLKSIQKLGVGFL